jgi:hypothetical protein
MTEKSITRKTVHNINDAEHSSVVQNSSKIFTSENKFFWIKKSGIICAPVRTQFRTS